MGCLLGDWQGRAMSGESAVPIIFLPGLQDSRLCRPCPHIMFFPHLGSCSYLLCFCLSTALLSHTICLSVCLYLPATLFLIQSQSLYLSMSLLHSLTPFSVSVILSVCHMTGFCHSGPSFHLPRLLSLSSYCCLLPTVLNSLSLVSFSRPLAASAH